MTGIYNIVAAATALLVTGLVGKSLIPYLKKLKYGQTIKEIGPTWHSGKQGTPTMGGIAFIIGIIVAMIVGFVTLIAAGGGYDFDIRSAETARYITGIIMALAFGFVGFLDDYIKVVKKRNLGLTALQKIVMQITIAAAYLATLYFTGNMSTLVAVPFFGFIDLGLFYFPIMMILIIGFVNAVNLTDGLDGLASSVTFVVALGFMIITGMLGIDTMSIQSSAIAGAMIGFLIYNFYPAKVFMGDTGSMFLGGSVVALAFGSQIPFILFFIGIIYLVEAFSVVIQVIGFKLTGKRIFKMSPIHHHFELKGMSEIKIVISFCFVTVVGVALAVAAVNMMFA